MQTEYFVVVFFLRNTQQLLCAVQTILLIKEVYEEMLTWKMTDNLIVYINKSIMTR